MTLAKSLLTFIVLLLLCSACNTAGNNNKLVVSPLPIVDNAQQLLPVWTSKVGKAKLGLANTITHYGDVLFVSDASGKITALARHSGKIVWQSKTLARLTTNVAVSAELAVVASADGQVIALRQQDGKPLWRVNVGNQVLAQPSITQDKVLVKTIHGEVIALSTANGQRLWSYAHEEPSLVLRRSSAVVYTKQWAIVGFADGQIAALALMDGKLQWLQPIATAIGVSEIERMVDLSADMLIAGNRLYAVTYQGQIASVELPTGRKLWQHALSSYTGMALAQGSLLTTNDEGEIWVFATQDGRVQWRQTTLKHRGLTAPAVLADYVLVGDAQGYLHVLARQQGKAITYTKISDAALTGSPLVIDRFIYVISDDGKIAAYRLK